MLSTGLICLYAPFIIFSSLLLGTKSVTFTFQQLHQVHWAFYQPLNWACLAWVRKKTHSVVWGLMEQRGTTDNNSKQLYSQISQITYHITVTWTSIQLHYTRLMTSFDYSRLHFLSLSVEKIKNNNEDNNYLITLVLSYLSF